MARSVASARDWPSTRMGASVTFSSTLMCGNRLKLWNTMPTSRRSALTSTPGPLTRSPCSADLAAESIGSSPLMQRSRVDLPQPEGPIRQTT